MRTFSSNEQVINGYNVATREDGSGRFIYVSKDGNVREYDFSTLELQAPGLGVFDVDTAKAFLEVAKRYRESL